MSSFVNLPFPVGGTFGATSATDGAYLEGAEFYVGDFDYSGGVEVLRSNRIKKLRVVRNAVTIGSGGDVTTGNLRPKRLVTFKNATYGAQVDGYVRLPGVSCAPVDEWLPAAGVAPNDLFYVVIEGPAVVLTDIAAAAGNLISIGNSIVSLTAVTSGATTAGRAAAADFATAATGLTLADLLRNTLGRALSAATTNSTNSSLLVDVLRTAL